MTPERWNEIIATAAATAIDECGEAPTIQKVAERAATLAAEWVCEEMANEGDVSARYQKMLDLYRRYMPPDSGISADEFLHQLIEILDRPLDADA